MAIVNLAPVFNTIWNTLVSVNPLWYIGIGIGLFALGWIIEHREGLHLDIEL